VTEAEAECLAIEEEEAEADTWMTPVIQYLTDDTCKADQEKAMKQQCARYTMINEDLYQRGYSTPLLKCITNKRAEYIIAEIHEGICQEFDPLHHTRPEELHNIISPWSFAIWGMDIIGPFSPGKGQTKFLLVGVDYFTKWIEAEPLASISAKNVQNFVWRSIVCRFGVPHTIITDNGRQFIDRGLQSFYDDLGIKSITTSVEHPQTNGQAEAANKVILNELKKRLGKAKGRWTEELIEVLWAYSCTPQTTTQETPYSLTYGTEAMIPVEVAEPTIRRQMFDLTLNEESLVVNLDLVSEFRDKSRIREAACKARASGTTQRSGRDVFRRATSSGECAVTREKMKGSSHPTGRGLSKSEKSHREELII